MQAGYRQEVGGAAPGEIGLEVGGDIAPYPQDDALRQRPLRLRQDLTKDLTQTCP